MEWYVVFGALLLFLIVFLLSGMPVAIAFGIVNLLIILLFVGPRFYYALALSCFESIAVFTFVAIPLFILMGEVILQSGLAGKVIECVEKWLVNFRGSIAISTIVAGAAFAAMTGVSMSSAAALGSVLLPEMARRNYDKGLATGVVAASGALAIMIPPSSLTVLLGGLTGISVGGLLIGGIIPGLTAVALMIMYIVVRCRIQPKFLPLVQTERTSLKPLLLETLKTAVPVIIIISSVIGMIFFGIATPTEAAATGAAGAFIVGGIFGSLPLKIVKAAIMDTVRISGMVLFIVVGSSAYSQILAMTGATTGLLNSIIGMSVSPFVILSLMLLILVLLGMFVDPASIMFLTTPIFMPIARALEFDMIWFGILFMICMEVGLITPPFGLNLFVVKGVAPSDFTMGDIVRGIYPFVILYVLCICIIIVFPFFATWLPHAMLGR